MGSDHDVIEFTGSFMQLNFVVTDHLPARRDEEVSINDGRDGEHAIEISDRRVAFKSHTYVSAEHRGHSIYSTSNLIHLNFLMWCR